MSRDDELVEVCPRCEQPLEPLEKGGVDVELHVGVEGGQVSVHFGGMRVHRFGMSAERARQLADILVRRAAVLDDAVRECIARAERRILEGEGPPGPPPRGLLDDPNLGPALPPESPAPQLAADRKRVN